MGSSNTIEQQTKLNAEFQKYIDDQTAIMNKKSEQAKADIAKAIDTYYTAGKFTDAKPLIAGSYQHLSTFSEWSLQNVEKMITSIRGAIFGGPPPTGSTKTTGAQAPDPNAVTKLASMELVIAAAAFDAIQGILGTITSQTGTDIKMDTQTKVLAPGLTLFICMMENQYSRSDFLTNNTIIQTFYIFETRLSVQQMGNLAAFDEAQENLKTLHGELETARTLIARIDEAISKLDPISDKFDDQYKVLSTRREAQNTNIKGLMDEIGKVGHERLLAVRRRMLAR
jgi:hypothetical protein